MESFFKYLPVLLIVILAIIAINFIIKNFWTIIAGIVIILIVYIFLTNNIFRQNTMFFLNNVSKKCHDFFDENVKDDEE